MDDLLMVVFADAEMAVVWLNASVPILAGRTPSRLIEAGHVDEVFAVLAGLASGAHA